jgi:hypothetical protein
MLAGAADSTFTKIFDTANSIPNVVGNFARFDLPLPEGMDVVILAPEVLQRET